MAETAVGAFLARVRADGARRALTTLASGGARDASLTWSEWEERSRAFAAALVSDGHRPGEVVAVLAGNRLEWPVAEMGILMAAGVSAGLYPTSAAPQVRQLLADCGASTVVVDTAEQLEKVRSVRDGLPALRTIVRGCDGGDDTVAWASWIARGRRALLEGPEAGSEIAGRVSAARGEDTAVLIYTSGSTGEPKGAEIPHRYLLASAASVRRTLGLTGADRTLSFLPFCHAGERIFGLHTRIACGMEAALVPDLDRLWEAVRAYRPTLFGGLPRFYEKVAASLRGEGERAPGPARERWERTVALGTELSRLRRAGVPPPNGMEEAWRREGREVLERAAAHFGGSLRLATSGGAALPRAAVELLDALGITVLGGYGLTEHLCAAFHRPDRYAFDTVGPPMAGTELRIAEDGEILVRRSAGTFSRYLGRPAETAAAFTADGAWLRTGDLGSIDGSGALRVTGRRKELIALSNGKKIAPLLVESALTGDPWIEQAMLYGEGRAYASALLVLRRQALEGWAAAQGRDPDDPRLLEDATLRATVAAAVERVNSGFSNPERVRRFALLAAPFAGDEVTPTLKLRRDAIAERYRDRLEALYHES
jgi:long-chain acyl-CoA synthetase